MKWFWTIWSVFALLMTATTLWSWRQAVKVGNVQLRIEPRTGSGYRDRPDAVDEQQATLWLLPEAAVESVQLRVDVREIVVQGTGSEKRTHTTEVWQQTTPLSAVEGEKGTWQGVLKLPEAGKAPFSFNAIRARVSWRALADIRFADGSLVTTEHELDSQPARGAGSRNDDAEPAASS